MIADNQNWENQFADDSLRTSVTPEGTYKGGEQEKGYRVGVRAY